MLCQARRCDLTATHRATAPDGETIVLCTPHADYARDGNTEVPAARRVNVEALDLLNGGAA